jgi:hypothetical protein
MIKDMLSGVLVAFLILSVITGFAAWGLSAFTLWIANTMEPDADTEDTDCDSARARAEQEAFFQMVL